MRRTMITAAAISALVCLTACSGLTGTDSVVTGEMAAQAQKDTSQEQSTEKADTADTGDTISEAEDFSLVYYSYADVLRENRDAIESYEEARDKAGGSDTSDAVAAVCDVTQDGMPELIFIGKAEEAEDDYRISVYTHQGNQNRRIGYFSAWDGTGDTTFCAFTEGDSADLCLFTGSRNEVSERVYTYAQYEMKGSGLSAVTTITKTEGDSVTYTMNGHDAGESDFYRQRKKFIDGVRHVLVRSAKGFDGNPWDTFLQADGSLGMNYDDMMYYLDHTYVPDDSKEKESTEGQLFPDSDSRYIFNDDLKDLSENDIRRAVNEIYARHGVEFDDSSVTDFFRAYSWYKPEVSENDFDEDTELNDYERANISFMRQYLRTKEAAAREASEEAARKASEEAARKASEEAAKKASEEAARKASEEAAKKATEQKAQENTQQSGSGRSENSSSGSGQQGGAVSLATALSRLQGAVGTSINGHTLQYEFTATVNDASGRQYYAFTVTRMEGGAWVFYHNYLVAVDGTGYASDASQGGRPSYQHGSTVSAGALQGF